MTRRISWIVVAGLAALAAAGCAKLQSEEECREAVFKQDPAFRQVLAKKDALDTQIRALQNKLSAEKRRVDDAIFTLHESYLAMKKKAEADAALIRRQLDPERQGIMAHLGLLKNDLAAHLRHVKDLSRALVDLEAMLAQKDKGTMNDAEIARLEQNKDAFEEKLSAVSAEIPRLKEEIKLLSAKLKLLKL